MNKLVCMVPECNDELFEGSLLCEEHDKMHAVVPMGGIHGEGKHAIVDKMDLDNVLSTNSNWHLDNKGYPITSIPSETTRSGRTKIRMHQVIMGRIHSIDHINRNPLDNRRSNLRIPPDSSTQLRNRTPQNRTSKYPGVDKRGNRYRAQISDGPFKPQKFKRKRADGTMEEYEGRAKDRRHLGWFTDEKDAARAYRDALKEIDSMISFKEWDDL